METERDHGRNLRWIWIMVAIVVAFSGGFLLRRSGNQAGSESQASVSGLAGEDGMADQAEQGEPQAWTCSMHPQIQLPEFGKCPICFMDLIPVVKGAQEMSGSPILELSPVAVALADIRTVPVTRKRLPVEVRLVGKVDFDETRFRSITARVAGRLDTLLVDFTGMQVRRGQKLAAVYSPDLYAAQVELLSALQAAREVNEGGGNFMVQTTNATVDAVRNRLRLWGMSRQQITAIETSGVAAEHLAITSPLSGTVVRKYAVEGTYVAEGSQIYAVADLAKVWVNLQAYEKDLVWVRVGQLADFAVAALPGRSFQGRIAFVDPILDEPSRTVRMRLDVDNGNGLLKPGMYVSAVVRGEADETHAPDVNAPQPPPLVIPVTAPLLTGKRAVVYVRLPDAEQPTFVGREVQLGPRTGDHYVVVAGLSEGEEVVVNGNFKIDSELQIRALPSMMSPAVAPNVPTSLPPAVKPPPSVQSHGHDQAALEPTSPGVTAPPMFLGRLSEMLDAYLGIQTALAADDDEQAAKSTREAAEILTGVVGNCLSAEAQPTWADDRGRLAAALKAVGAASDITSRRIAFLPLSRELWRILQSYGYRETETVRWIHCPMAFANAGADWIQRDASVANPYYGASMLRCGSQVDSLPPVTTDQGGQ